jgi:hypothetical protein
VVQPSSFVTISTRGQDAVADGVRSSGLHATGLCVAYLILANGSVGSDNFNVTGLLFDGGTFTTLVPATID